MYLIIFYVVNLYLSRNRRLSSESRYSSYGVVKNRKEVRPLTDKEFQQGAIQKVYILIKYISCKL